MKRTDGSQLSLSTIRYKSLSISADEGAVAGTTVTFSHEVWEDDTFCPVHNVGTVTVRIIDPPQSPQLRINDVVVDEGVAHAVFTVSLSSLSNQTVTVAFATADDTATAGEDYTNSSQTLSIPPNTRTATITVPVTDDSDDEGDESFTVTLSRPTNAAIGDGVGLGTITDNDGGQPPETPSLDINDVTVNEGAGGAVFTVTLSPAVGQAITVEYGTADGTAKAGSDYQGRRGTLTIPTGRQIATIRVPVIDDDADEEDETFTVNLSDARGATITDGVGVGTIRDDDGDSPPPGLPQLRIGDTTVDEDSGRAVFTVSLSSETSETVTVTYTTSDGAATAGSDFASKSGALAIPAGQRSVSLRVPVIDDDAAEEDETFTVTIEQPARRHDIGRRGRRDHPGRRPSGDYGVVRLAVVPGGGGRVCRSGGHPERAGRAFDHDSADPPSRRRDHSDRLLGGTHRLALWRIADATDISTPRHRGQSTRRARIRHPRIRNASVRGDSDCAGDLHRRDQGRISDETPRDKALAPAVRWRGGRPRAGRHRRAPPVRRLPLSGRCILRSATGTLAVRTEVPTAGGTGDWRARNQWTPRGTSGAAHEPASMDPPGIRASPRMGEALRVESRPNGTRRQNH